MALSFDDLVPGRVSFDDLVPAKDPKIGQPEELTFAERNIAPVLDKFGDLLQSDTGPVGAAARFFLNNGNARGAPLGRAAMGAADPGVALVQLAANATGNGGVVNKGIAEKEGEYQAARKEAGSEGVDPLRAAGSIAITAPLGGVGAGVMRGAAVGAGTALLDPVRDGGEDFWGKKRDQAVLGAAGGAVLSPLMGALARVISPKASVNADVELLRREGVQPTIGQTAGGWANTLEEKAQSLPIVGDAITAMRNRARDQFNEAAINRSLAPIGERVKGAGHEAVAEAGDKLSAAYQQALGSVNHVNFNTPTFNANFSQLQQMATGLAPQLAEKFDRTLKDVVLRRMSPNGSIMGSQLKEVDSELGKIAAKWQKSALASESEFGDAIKQLQAILKDGVRDADPTVANALAAADKGWAHLVRVEGAAKSAKNADGVFTPAQLNASIQRSDHSVRGRAVARGTALDQDLGSAAQNVLGNKYPDSGTVGRGLVAGGGLLSGMIHPALPAALLAGAGAYTPAVQNVLRLLLTARPDEAPLVAKYLRQIAGPAAVGVGPLVQEMN